jgi:signal transduction histidine kinase
MGELYDAAVEEAGGTLVTQVAPAPVTGNRELLGQVIANLIDNAVKYGVSPPDGPRISLNLAIHDGMAELSVADRGPGIPQADRGRVLDRFVRLETSRTRPGSGLGLSLAAAVARLHNGTIEIADNAPGLKVVLRLPVTGPT